MNKRTFGDILKKKRQELSLTQRKLADRLGVKASHVAQLETGRRSPSLSLIKRTSDTFRLDPQKLFLLAHPETEFLLKLGDKRRSQSADAVWQRFATNSALLARERVSVDELKVLKQVSLLGRILSERQFLFVLKTIRLAIEDD